jgi:hypothetical protein
LPICRKAPGLSWCTLHLICVEKNMFRFSEGFLCGKKL